jgi:hypothetical protein
MVETFSDLIATNAGGRSFYGTVFLKPPTICKTSSTSRRKGGVLAMRDGIPTQLQGTVGLSV